MRLAILSCGSAKAAHACEARDLYTGGLFRAARRHLEDRGIQYEILSAKHGLVSPSLRLDPYDMNMQQRLRGDAVERDRWLACLRLALDGWCRAASPGLLTLEVHAGKVYADVVRGALAGRQSVTITTPLEGLQIGQRLSWYKQRREGGQQCK